MSLADCPNDDVLVDFAVGELSDASVDRIIMHVDSCEACQHRFETLTAQTDGSGHESLTRLKSHRPHDTTDTVARLLVPRGDSLRSNPDDRPTIPDRIGPYVVTRQIAIGGMATIYEGRHVNLGRSVAIKWLAGKTELSRRSAEQVMREWRAHGQLSHPNIVTATDAGLIDGRPYLVTELIDGIDLSRIVRNAGPLTVADAVTIGTSVASALDYLHRQGIAHLDIKPSNIMIDRQGKVKLLDLGTARTVGPTHSQIAPRSVAHADDFGTLDYLAPERTFSPANGSRDGDADEFASDIYSLGCTLHFLLRGQPPFATTIDLDSDLGSNVLATKPDTDKVSQLIRAHRHRQPPAISFQSSQGDARSQSAIQALIDELLRKKPVDRPSSMEAVADRLTSIIDPASIESANRLSALVQSAGPEISVIEASGQTTSLTDLIRPATKRAITMPLLVAVASILLMAGGGLWMKTRSSTSTAIADSLEPDRGAQRSISDSDLAADLTEDRQEPRTERAISDEQPPDLSRLGTTRRSPHGYVILGSEYVGLLKDKPQQNTEYLSRSKPLLKRLQATDPTITHAAISTVAPHDPIADMQWSPDGTRLAMLTTRHRLRIYGWDGTRLTLQHTTRGETPLQWAKAICWNPVDRSLIAASQSFLASIHFDENGNKRVKVFPITFTDIRSVKTLVNNNRTLILVQNEGTLNAYDPVSNQAVDEFVDLPVNHYDSIGNGPRCLINHDRGLDQWTAKFDRSVTLPSESAYGSTRQASGWTFRRASVLDAPLDDSVQSIRYARDFDHVIIREPNGLMVCSLDGQPAAKFPLSNRTPDDYVFADDSPRATSELILTHADRLELYRDTSLLASEISPTLITKCAGQQLKQPRIAMHPTEQRLAVAWRGHAEIWNFDLQTVSRLPACASYRSGTPLPMRPGHSLFRHDGSGVLVDPNGQFIAPPISRPPPENENFQIVNISQWCLETGQLIQSSASQNKITQRPLPIVFDQVGPPIASLSQIPGEIYQQVSGKTDYETRSPLLDWAYSSMRIKSSNGALVPRYLRLNTAQAYRHSVARDVPRFCQVLNSGAYWVHDLDDPDCPVVRSGRINDIGDWPASKLSHDAMTLFTVSHDKASITIVATDLETGQDLWRHETDKLRSVTQIALDARGDPLFGSEWNWLRLDRNTGAPDATWNNPRIQFGFRHDRMRQSIADQSFISWPRTPYVQPAAIWDSDANLVAMIFATEPNQWISIAPDGTIIDRIKGRVSPDRYIIDGKTQTVTQANTESDTSQIQPEDSLVILCTHGPERHSIRSIDD